MARLPAERQVLPVYYTPRLSCFVKCLNAVGTDFYPLTIHTRPLQVEHTAVLARRIVMTAQEFASSDHDGFFTAVRTTSGHR